MSKKYDKELLRLAKKLIELDCKLTVEELGNCLHALGIQYNSKWTSGGYRNYYNAEPGSHDDILCSNAVKLGYMCKAKFRFTVEVHTTSMQTTSEYYFVSDLGIQLIRDLGFKLTIS